MRRLCFLMFAALIAVTSYAQKSQRVAPKTQTVAHQLMGGVQVQGTKANTLDMLKNHQPKMKAVGRRNAAKVSQLISEQPEGTLVTFERSGKCYEYSYSTGLVEGVQDGLIINVVIAPDGQTMYLQNPLSGVNTGAWVKGTVNEDGTLLTVPLGQTIYQSYYGYGLELALYDVVEGAEEPQPDFDAKEITFTITDNSLVLNGTSENRFLGGMYDDDYSWQGSGDFESVYTLFEKTPITPPAGLQTEEWAFVTAYYGSYSWEPFQNDKALLAFDGDDVYLQGFNEYVPEAWIKGVKNADGSLTFANSQFLGVADGNAVYFNGYTDEGGFGADVTFAFNGKDAYVSQQYIFINGKPNDMYYFTYAMPGAAISHETEAVVEVPIGLPFTTYVMTYVSEDENVLQKVQVGIDEENVYIAGLFPDMPEGIIKGVIEGDKIIFDGTQFMGYYEGYTMYMMAHDGANILDKFECKWDADTKSFETDADLYVSILRHTLLYYAFYGMPSFEVYIELPAIPATPEVVEFDEWQMGWSGEEYALVCFNMEKADVDGNNLFSDKLYYRLYSDIERDVQPIVFDKDLYGLEEDMVDVPYDFQDEAGNFYDWGSWSAFFGYNKEVALLDPVCKGYSRIGVQAVYKGGGEENVSPIAWFKIRDYTDSLTWVAGDQDFKNFQLLGEETMAEGYTVTFDLGQNPNEHAPRYYSDDKSARVYKHNEFTLAGRKLMGAVIYTASEMFLPNLSASEGEIVKDEENLCYYWTGDATSKVTFANDELGENTQLRITRIDLAYGEPIENTVDPTVLVEVPEDAEIVDYTMKANAQAYDGQGWVSIDRNEIVKVAFTDEEMYVQGIGGIYSQFADAWIKGVIDGDKVVFMSRQLLGTVGDASMYFIGSDAITVLDAIEFNWDAKNRVLTSPEDAIVVLNADVNELAPYAYYNSIELTEGGLLPVDAPDGMTVEPYVMASTDYYQTPTYNAVGVGFVGNDVYVQGLCSYLPEAWVKGSISDNTVVFEGNQYMGNYAGYDFFFSQDDVQFDFDAATGTLSFGGLLYTYYGDGSSYYYGDYYQAPVLTKVIEMAGTPADPIINGIRQSTYGPILEYTIPLIDTEGHNMLASKLSYQFFKEEKGEVSPVVLSTSDYIKLDEDMSIIPFTFSDNYDIYSNMLYMNMNFDAWSKVGIKSIYTGGGETHESNITWLDLFDAVRQAETEGISSIVAGSDATYTDLQGRSATAAAKGLLIMQVRQADGTTKTAKVVRK